MRANWGLRERPGAANLLDRRAAEVFCHQLVRRAATNFYWGFMTLPREQRVAIYALYGFSRQVDDEADRAGPARLPERLEVHRERVHQCARGEYADPVMQVLAHAVRRFSIPQSELLALIDGVEMDCYRTRYQTWEELQQYCRLVASVVGRMCVRIFGFTDPAVFDRADELGLAMQLTNCLRDVREDAQLGRIYLPQEDLQRFGVTEEEVLGGHPGAGWTPLRLEREQRRPPGAGMTPLLAFEAQRARDLFASGLRVVTFIPRRPAICVRTMAGIYQRILNRISQDPELPFRQRASLSKAEKLYVALGSWLRFA